MKYLVCAVYDSGVGSFGQTMLFRSKGEAHRSFVAACKKPDSDFAMYSKDFTLFIIGNYDQSTGELTNLDANIPIISAQDALFINREEQIELFHGDGPIAKEAE